MCRGVQSGGESSTRAQKGFFVVCPAIGLNGRVFAHTIPELVEWCNQGSMFRLHRASLKEDGTVEIW
jgi:hypothetical protein